MNIFLPTGGLPTGSTPTVPQIGPAAGLAVAPTSAGNPAQNNSNSTNFGHGGGQAQASTVAMFEARGSGKWTNPSTADSGSVIGAQTAEDGELPTLGPDLPAVEMPNPLPTSQLLLWMTGQA